MSTYKFSKLISIHFFKELVERIDNRSRHFLFGDHFMNSHNLSLESVWIIAKRKLILDTVGTQRVNQRSSDTNY